MAGIIVRNIYPHTEYTVVPGPADSRRKDLCILEFYNATGALVSLRAVTNNGLSFFVLEI
jgi:hypothetical protein